MNLIEIPKENWSFGNGITQARDEGRSCPRRPPVTSDRKVKKSFFRLGQLPFEIRLPLDESLHVGKVPQSLRGPSSGIAGGAELAVNELDRGRDADATALEISRHCVFNQRGERRVLAELNRRVVGAHPIFGVFMPLEPAKARGFESGPWNFVVSPDRHVDVERRPRFLAPELDSETSDERIPRSALFEDAEELAERAFLARDHGVPPQDVKAHVQLRADA